MEYFGPSVKRKVTQNTIECDHCDKRFGNEPILNKHIQQVHDSKKLDVVNVEMRRRQWAS